MQMLWQSVLLENRDKIDFMMQENFGYSNRKKRSTLKFNQLDIFEQVSFGPFHLTASPIMNPKQGEILMPFNENDKDESILFLNICSSIIFCINGLLIVNLYKLRFNKSICASK